MDKVQYRITAITRHNVTRYFRTGDVGGSASKGEFDNYDTAYSVAYALCKEEHDRLGWAAGDERISYPEDHRVSLEPRTSVGPKLSR